MEGLPRPLPYAEAVERQQAGTGPQLKGRRGEARQAA